MKTKIATKYHPNLRKYCKLNNLDILIYTGKKCQYCKSKTIILTDHQLYRVGHDFKGKNYVCKKCDAHVKIYDGTNIGKGVVANWELRQLKYHTRQYFNNICNKHMSLRASSTDEAVNNVYSWISKELQIDRELTKMSLFTIQNCKDTLELCKPFIEYKYN